MLNIILSRLHYVLLHAENKLLPRILIAAEYLSLTLELFLQFQLLFQVLLVAICAVFQFALQVVDLARLLLTLLRLFLQLLFNLIEVLLIL